MKEESLFFEESRETLVADAVDEFRARRSKGQAPDPEEFANQHPKIADTLRRILPALQVMDPPDRPETGGTHTLGDFEIKREIGRGGMGVVYEAEQVSLGRHVALKVLPFAAVMDPRQLQRFKNEAQAAAHLHHTHIVPVYSIGCERGVHYYAMQHIEGPTVAQMIAQLKATAGKDMPGSSASALKSITKGNSTQSPQYCRGVARLGIQAAGALDHAHQQGVVHRDIKPANLIVDAGGHLWITDFGLASFTNNPGLTMTGDIVGTVRYMSPEQALAKRVPIDHRTDIYSLGITLYELLTLKGAFEGDDPHKVIQDIAFKDPKSARSINPAVPHELETILIKAMAKDPSERYETAQELAEDLERFLQHKPIRARRPNPFKRAEKWARRHRPLVWAAAAFLVAFTIVLGISVQRIGAALGRADDTLGFAQGAVEEFLTHVGIHNLEDKSLPRPALRALLEKALEFYETYPGNRSDADAHKTRAGILFSLHRYDDSLEAFETALQLDPEYVLGRLGRASVLAIVGRPREGLAILDRLVDRAFEMDRYEMHYYRTRGHVLAKLGRHEEALAAYDHALEIDPGRARVHNNRGGVLSRMGRHEEALAAVDRALEINPRDALSYANRGGALRRLGRHEESLAACDRALELDRGLASAHNHRGSALLGLCRHEDALAAYDHALEIDRKHVKAHSNRSAALFKMGRHEEHLAAVDRALDIDPEFAGAHYNRGTVLSALGQNEEALAAYDRALEIDPEFAGAHYNRGAVLLAKGQLDDALAAYREAIRLRPDHANSHDHLGVVLQDKGQLDDAIAEHREAIRLEPDHANVHYNLGVALKANGQLDDALAEYREAIRLKPDHVNAHSNLGLVLQAKGQLDDALAAYREAIRLEPDHAIAHYNRGNALLAKGQLDDALAAYREAIRLDPGYAKAHSNLGLALQNKGQLDEAIAACREAIRLEPDNAIAHSNLGNALYGKGQLDEALAAYREAIRLEPDHAIAHSNLGNALLAKGQLDDALAAYREAIRLNPDNYWVHNNVGLVRAKRGQLDGAIAAFREAIRRHPDHANAHNNLGVVLRQKDDLDGAIAAHREAIRLKPDFALAHSNLGSALHVKGDLDDAIVEYREAIRLKPDHAWAHSDLGNVLGNKGDYQGAIEAYEEALELQPTYGGTHNSLAWLRATCTDLRYRNPEKAVQSARRAVQLVPKAGAFWNTLGVAYYRAANWRSAVEALERSMQLRRGGDANDWFFIAMAKWQLGQKDEARKWYARATQKEITDPELKRFRDEAAKLLGIEDQK